ncbi:MAG: PepSY-like domain-containing protein [Flavobacterium sp.]
MEDKLYEAEFRQNGTETSVTYDLEGNRKELETEISTNKLPSAAIAYINKNYPKNKITTASKIIDDKNTATFEAEIKKGSKTQDVLFTEQGIFIR